MTESRRHKEIVRSAYDEQASTYAQRTTLQGGNLGRLLARLRSTSGAAPAGSWLDVGAGAGLLAHRLASEGVLADSLSYVGVDLSQRMVAEATRSAPSGARFLVADVESLPFETGRFDVVISNSVLHWVGDPRDPHRLDPALAEMARVLRPGGWLAVSVAAEGTARRFQRAYHAVLAELAAGGVSLGPIRPDPIGCVALHELVDALQRVGVTPRSADLVYEPASYATPEAYAEDVAAYGWGIYLAPLAADARDEAWRRIVQRFAATEGPGRYLHDQYMAYAIAHR